MNVYMQASLRFCQNGGIWADLLQNIAIDEVKSNHVHGVNKSKNAGWTSVDRSTKAILSTYNTWIQLSRLQKIYLFHWLKLC